MALTKQLATKTAPYLPKCLAFGLVTGYPTHEELMIVTESTNPAEVPLSLALFIDVIGPNWSDFAEQAATGAITLTMNAAAALYAADAFAWVKDLPGENHPNGSIALGLNTFSFGRDDLYLVIITDEIKARQSPSPVVKTLLAASGSKVQTAA